jgi:predicted 2-oxoglutarate/Fe(II)-dependent dioxygenase YbiX
LGRPPPSETVIGVILEVMTTSARPRRHLASSPFRPDPEPIIEQYALDDLVSHDSYGVGRVVQLEAGAVMVDFRSQTVRIISPFSKLAKL